MAFNIRPIPYAPPKWPFVIDYSHPWTRELIHLGMNVEGVWRNLILGNEATIVDGSPIETQYGIGQRLQRDPSPPPNDQSGVHWGFQPLAWTHYDFGKAISFGGWQSSAGLYSNDGGIITSSPNGYFSAANQKTWELGVLDGTLYGQLSDSSSVQATNSTSSVIPDLVAGLDTFRGAMFTWDGLDAGVTVVRAHKREWEEVAWSGKTTDPAGSFLQQWGGEIPSVGPNYAWDGIGLLGFLHGRYMPPEEREYTTSEEFLAWDWLAPYGRRTYFLQLDPTKIPVATDDLTHIYTFVPPIVDLTASEVMPEDLAQLQTIAVPLVTPDYIQPDAVTHAHVINQPTVETELVVAPEDLTHLHTVGESSLLPLTGEASFDFGSLLKLDMAGGNEIEFSLDVTFPGLRAEWALQNGNVFVMDAELPCMENELFPGYQGDTELPCLEADWILLVGLNFVMDVTLPALRAVATGAVPGDFGFNVQLPVLQADWLLETGRDFVIDADLPCLQADWEMRLTTDFVMGADLPECLEAEWTLLAGIVFVMDADLPECMEADFLVLEDFSGLGYSGWAINTNNFYHSPYDYTEFDGMGRIGGKTYAATATGLYKLEGEDDGGVPIEAYFLLGEEDFGVEALKAQRVAYLGYSTDGGMELLVRTDTGGNDLLRYPVEAPYNSDGATPARVKLGRGLKGRHWQVGIQNVDGADFQIERIGMGVWNSGRKR